MANSHELKKYLIEDNNPFLLNEENNGKTIMLSGVWGAGKTHFWQHEIEPTLSQELKKQNKACIYVSLYGKTSIDEIKLEIFKEAYKSIEGENTISKTASFFSSIAPTLHNVSEYFEEKSLIKTILEPFQKLNQKAKDKKSKKILEDGTVICLDDFERKSKTIDLNDLFGFISQLALEMQCKVVIILNSDVFEGKEAEVFKNVKEKTINKYLKYEPKISELFDLIFDDEKKQYKSGLNEFKTDILKAIEETEELNARLYIQVLDNCLEWHEKREFSKESSRVIVLTTINFVLNHMILEYSEIKVGHDVAWDDLSDKQRDTRLSYVSLNSTYPMVIVQALHAIVFKDINEHYQYREYLKKISKNLTPLLQERIYKLLNKETTNAEITHADDWLKNNGQEIEALWKYGYQLYYVADVDEVIYNEIAKFIETGILLEK